MEFMILLIFNILARGTTCKRLCDIKAMSGLHGQLQLNRRSRSYYDINDENNRAAYIGHCY